MKRRFWLKSTILIGAAFVLGLGSCIQSILFGVAPLLI